jgi:predicted ATPase/DNA-binding CsgD family transcriptional regulator
VSHSQATAALLPVPPAHFIGRAAELTGLCELLSRREVRLLTLAGVGGCGKTRLALEAVKCCGADLEAQIVFVDLAPLLSSELVGKTIAQAVGLREALSAEELATSLADRSVLLILDNFEHVLGAASLVSFLLSACPRLRVLVTSRTVLGLSGEYVFCLRRMETEQSIELFVDRARAADTNFVVGADAHPILAEICDRLDGLPLAIELASAWVRVLPLNALLARLERRLPLLKGGGNDRPVRHQALRNTIDWSYRLLDEADQALLCRLAVFRGGWTLDAACKVNSDHDRDVLACMASLLDKSFVESVPGPTGEPRFRMLETIREFALEQALIRGEVDDAARAALEYLLGLCESEAASQRGRAQAGLFAQLNLELDNIRAALTWALESPDRTHLGLRLSVQLHKFWKEGAHWGEGRQWLDRILARPDPVDPAELAGALTVAGDLAHLQGDSIGARMYAARSVALWRQGPRQVPPLTLRLMARLAIDDGHLARAQALCEEAMDAAAQVGSEVETGLAFNVMGMLSQSAGDLTTAMAQYQHCLTIMRMLGDLAGTAFVLWEIGQVAELQGDFGRASTAFAEGLATGEASGDRKEMARCLLGLARVALHRGADLDSVESLASASLEMFRAMGAEREIEQAQATLDSLRERRLGTFRERARRSDGLTAREVEIMTLIAEGASNSTISTRLVLSIRTVERHVENIYAKLGVQGKTARASVAGYAARVATGSPPMRRIA